MVEKRPDVAATPGPEENRNPETHFVLTVHGIRTHGQWQERLGALLQKEAPSAQVLHFKYGVFSSLAYAFPLLRMINVWRFRRHLEQLAGTHPGARIDIVAHSFGTFIVGHSLAKISPNVGLRVNTLVLAGSVLKVWFPWDELIKKGVVRRLVNECGTEDNILLLTQLAVLFTGMAGRIGFSGLLDDSFKNRFYEFGHGGYFKPFGEAGPDPDQVDGFMRKQWVPLLTTDAPVADHDVRKASVLTPLQYFLLDKADPIKLLGYGAILFALVWFLWVVPNRDRAIAEREKTIAEQKATIAEQKAAIADRDATIERTKAAAARAESDAIAGRAFQAMHAFSTVVSGDANLQRRADLSPTRKKLLETASGLFRDMAKQLHPSEMGEKARGELAQAYIEIAWLTSEIGSLNSGNVGVAIDYLEKAIGILDRLNRQNPGDPKTLWAQARALSGLGEAYLNQHKLTGAGDPSRAQASFERALEIVQEKLGPKNVREEGGNYAMVIASTWIDLGVLDSSQAQKYYEKAVSVLDNANAGGSTGELKNTDDYGWLLINLANLQVLAKNPKDARKNLSNPDNSYEMRRI
jgi:tetratricopeptide (TPR) repeat protein